MATDMPERSPLIPLWLVIWLAVVGVVSAVEGYRASQQLDWMDRPDWEYVANSVIGGVAMVGVPTIVVRFAFLLAGGWTLSRWRAVSIAILMTALWLPSVGKVHRSPPSFDGGFVVP